mmetsp:Transcript_16217/g.50306  ORF Transcript_16217/g.50306 Transcript_16217/m.50306 type:complete len:131 (-) Transcript_16217:674-1066(-)
MLRACRRDAQRSPEASKRRLGASTGPRAALECPGSPTTEPDRGGYDVDIRRNTDRGDAVGRRGCVPELRGVASTSRFDAALTRPEFSCATSTSLSLCERAEDEVGRKRKPARQPINQSICLLRASTTTFV